jgi:hypothetical protein
MRERFAKMLLYVEKDTDLMRSTFVAIGLAKLMDALPLGGHYAVRVRDMGSCYAVEAPYSAEEAQQFLARRQGQLPQLLPAIIKEFSDGEQKELRENPDSLLRYKYLPRDFRGPIADYKAEKQKQEAAKASKTKERQEGDADVRHADYPVWAHLCSYFGKGSVMRSMYPSALHTWWAHQGQAASSLLDMILHLYSQTPNDYAGAAAYWAEQIKPSLVSSDFSVSTIITASSAVSPTTVQGNNRVAVGQNLNNNSLDTFWLEMYLAFAGYLVVGMPYRSGNNVLLYYPIPANISFQRLKNEAFAYRQSAETRRLYDQYSMERSKLDALAYLHYYRALVQTLAAQADDFFDEERLAGLVGYFYKDIGGTQIPFDETVFALPAWLGLEVGDYAAALTLLEAHIKLISSIRGPRYELTGDELTLVGAYRQFITTGGTQAWLDFVIQHHFYRFSKMGESQSYVPDIHRSLVEETLMALQTDKQDYRPILENPGFQAVASAIRACTVTERYYQDVKNLKNRPFHVRHGLGADLLRHAHDAERFLAELSSFLHDYARESSNAQANTGETRAFVSADNIADVVQLVSVYGSNIVAHLLVAIGYASDYRKSDNA